MLIVWYVTDNCRKSFVRIIFLTIIESRSLLFNCSTNQTSLENTLERLFAFYRIERISWMRFSPNQPTITSFENFLCLWATVASTASLLLMTVLSLVIASKTCFESENVHFDTWFLNTWTKAFSIFSSALMTFKYAYSFLHVTNMSTCHTCNNLEYGGDTFGRGEV